MLKINRVTKTIAYQIVTKDKHIITIQPAPSDSISIILETLGDTGLTILSRVDLVELINTLKSIEGRLATGDFKHEKN